MEPNWPKAVYLYVMSGIAVLVMAVGAVTAALGLVHVIAPGFGQDDTIERVGIGVSKIAEGIIDSMNEDSASSAQEFCERTTDDDDELEECLDENSGTGDEEMDLVIEGIGEVQGEFDRQTRNAGLNSMLRGLATIAVAFFVYRFHWRRSDLGREDAARAASDDATPPPAAPLT